MKVIPESCKQALRVFNVSTHHACRFLIFVEMKGHFLQYDIELLPLPEGDKLP